MCILCENIKTTGLEIKNLNCQAIISISHIEGLQELNCSNCPSITSVPMIDGLHALNCSGCKWLHINNFEFDDNIKKLKRLQIWFRGILLGTRLKKIILHIIPLYYHPLAKGGYLHKRNMLYFIESIQDSSCIE